MHGNGSISLQDAAEALKTGRGRGIKVAILDSGVEATNRRLSDLRLEDDVAIVDNGLRLQILPGEARDLFGHGTAVCEIIHRLAPEAALGSFRVLGEQLHSRTAIIQEAARLALERGYHILNCSFGCGRREHVLQYKAWIDEAYLKNRHIVSACNNSDFRQLEWPGHFPTVISVRAVSSPDAETLYREEGNLVEFAAAGEGIEVAWVNNSRKKVTGSSFAAPHATGLLARLLSELPALNTLEAKSVLQKLAQPLASSP